MLDAYIYNGIRTPFGRHAGALARMRPDDMLAAVISAVVEQSPFDPAKIEDVVVGCGNQGGEDARCVARHAALVAGLPIEVCAFSWLKSGEVSSSLARTSASVLTRR